MILYFIKIKITPPLLSKICVIYIKFKPFKKPVKLIFQPNNFSSKPFEMACLRAKSFTLNFATQTYPQPFFKSPNPLYERGAYFYSNIIFLVMFKTSFFKKSLTSFHSALKRMSGAGSLSASSK